MILLQRAYLIVCDGDGAFKSHFFKDFCVEHRIRLFEHTPRSADLNPIENLWNVGNESIADYVFEHKKWRDGVQRNAKNMSDFTKIVLKFIRRAATNKYVSSLIQSMPGRVKEVIKKNGWKIKK